MNLKAVLASVIIVSLFFHFAGCDQDEDQSGGRFVLKITDAPFPIDKIEEAGVTITKVEVRQEGDTTGSPFLVLLEDTLKYNLLELRNGVTADLLDMEVPAGQYNLIRLYVEGAWLKVQEGEEFHVKVPGGTATGIKIFIDPSLAVVGGLTTEVLLDFDVEKSFVVRGNPNSPAGIKGFNFKPVIRAVNNTTAGIVEGNIMDSDSTAVGDARVWISSDTIVSSAFSDMQGYYAFPGIKAGVYDLSAVKEGYDTITIEGIEVVEGNRTAQDFYLESDGT